VKIEEAIGINLSSEQGYNTDGRLLYHVTKGNKTLCGNNASRVSWAKIIERVR
jgi:hypothetical protein